MKFHNFYKNIFCTILGLVIVFQGVSINPQPAKATPQLLANSTSINATKTTAGRKTFYSSATDKYYAFVYDGVTDMYGLTSTAGDNWQVEANFQEPVDSTEFSVAYANLDESNIAVYQVFENSNYDVSVQVVANGRADVVKIFDGTSNTNKYRIPRVAVDSNGKVWVSAVKTTEAGQQMVGSRSAETFPVYGHLSWDAAGNIGFLRNNIYNNDILPMANAEIMAFEATDDGLDTLKYNGVDTWQGLGFIGQSATDKTFSAVTDNNNDVNIAYIAASNSELTYRKFDYSQDAWQSSRTISANRANPVINIQPDLSDISIIAYPSADPTWPMLMISNNVDGTSWISSDLGIVSSGMTVPAYSVVKKYIALYAEDGEDPYYAVTADFIITDVDAPTTNIVLNPATPNGENNWYKGTVPTITLSGDDGDGLGIDMQYYKWDDALSYSTYSTPFNALGGSHTLSYYSRDLASNIENSNELIIKYDALPPAGTFSIANNATYSKTPTVTLKSAISDGGGSGISNMRFSNNGTSWSAWQTYAASKSWNMTVGYGGSITQGTKRVWAQYKDAAGNTISKSDTIIYDKTAPTGTIKINNGAATTRSKYVTLNLAARDNSSGPKYMRFSNNGIRWTCWKTYSTRYTRWNMTSSTYGGGSAKGIKKVYVQFYDRAGNISLKKYDTIKYW